MRIALLASTLAILIGLAYFLGLGTSSPEPSVASSSSSDPHSQEHSVSEPVPRRDPAPEARWPDSALEPATADESTGAPVASSPVDEPGTSPSDPLAPLEPEFEWKWNRAHALAEAAKLDRAPDELVSNPVFSSMQEFLSKLAEHREVDPSENLEGAFALFLNADYHLVPDLLVDAWVGLLEYGPGVEVSGRERKQLRPVLLACSAKIREVDARLAETYGAGTSPLTEEEAESFVIERRLECGEVYFELMLATRRVLGDERFAEVAESFRNMGLYPE